MTFLENGSVYDPLGELRHDSPPYTANAVVRMENHPLSVLVSMIVSWYLCNQFTSCNHRALLLCPLILIWLSERFIIASSRCRWTTPATASFCIIRWCWRWCVTSGSSLSSHTSPSCSSTQPSWLSSRRWWFSASRHTSSECTICYFPLFNINKTLHGKRLPAFTKIKGRKRCPLYVVTKHDTNCLLPVETVFFLAVVM